jgi:type IV secretory pathway TraG/TraD family ATPase VirD4
LALFHVDALTAQLNAWSEGTRGWLLLYGLVALFSFAGLRRGKANGLAYILWPFTSVATLIVGGVVSEAIVWLTVKATGLTILDTSHILMLGLYMLTAFIGGLYWAKRAQPHTVAGERRGALVLDGAHAQRRTEKLRSKAKSSSQKIPLTLAGVAMPPEDETKHTKIMGATGTGKSTGIRELMDAALVRGDRAVIADPDGGYLARFYDPERGDIVLNPFDSRSAKWDLFAELKNPYDADELAQAFIPDRSSDPTWTNFARTLFSAVTSQAQNAEIRDVGELYRLLTAASREELKIMVEGTPAAAFLEDGSEKIFQGARTTVTAAVRALDYVRRQKATEFSVREWIKNGSGVLFLPYQADQISSLKALISIWMRLAIFQTMSLGEGDHRIWFVVDELDALGVINGLPDALARLRKFGGRCVLGLQSIAQASTHYGPGLAQTIIENCGNTLILRCSASEHGGTAQYASRLIGEREVVRLVRSQSRSSGPKFGSDRDTEGHSEQTTTELAVMAAQIEQLPDRNGYLKFASQPEWMRVSFPIYETQKIAAPFAPAA